ncbi:transcription factor LHW [Citrus sinensis]|nr:transcription factor LHW [Citrus sinensis]
MLSKGCDEGHSLLDSNHTPYNLHSLKGRVDGDFFPALNNPPTHLHQHILRKVDSSSFSGMGTEHLLEAVVSRANSVSKQISDDNVSCRTTVTQISISSIPTIFPSSGQVTILKPGENPRPRPKDHQMIQGSAKEAQEIVPEGTKLISLIFTNDFDFFFGSQSMVCSIIVEDLNPPRQLLVEVIRARFALL